MINIIVLIFISIITLLSTIYLIRTLYADYEYNQYKKIEKIVMKILREKTTWKQ